MTTETCKRELAIEVPAEEAERELKTVTAQYARVARIPGFRPGHAPSSLVLRRFRADIRNDVVQALLPKFFDQVVKERKWSVVGQPRFEELKFDEAQPLRCKAVFEVYPEFELTSYQGLEVEEDLVQVTDADVDQTLEKLRQRAATFEVVEDRAAQEDDLVIVNYRSPAADIPEARDAVVELGGKRALRMPCNFQGTKIERASWQASNACSCAGVRTGRQSLPRKQRNRRLPSASTRTGANHDSPRRSCTSLTA